VDRLDRLFDANKANFCASTSDALLYTYGKHADDRRFVLADQRGALPSADGWVLEAAKLELIDRSSL
jgi:hypothetical protein